MKRGVGQRAYALRIADADAFAGDREVGVDAVLISQLAAHAQQAAAAHGGERLHLEPVLVELERAVQLAQAVGQVFERERAVLEIDAALQARIASSGPCASTWKVVVPLAVRSGSSVSASLRLMEPLAVMSRNSRSITTSKDV